MKNQPHIHIIENQNQWEQAVLTYIVERIEETLIEKGICSISLSGGSTPKRIYELLANEGSERGLDWNTVHLYWGDERAVPHDHSDSNYKMVKEALLDHIPIPNNHVFPIPNPDQPEKAAQAYEHTLQSQFSADGSTFDITLLGLGDDGHTASIFPHSDLVTEQKAWVKEVYLEDQDTYRISVTAPVINRSQNIAFLVKGANKAEALKEVLDGKENPKEYPAQLIRKSPNVHYFLDKEAAEKISN